MRRYVKKAFVLSLMLIFMTGCAEQEENSTYIKKIADVKAATEDAIGLSEQGGECSLEFDNLSVKIVFPSGWVAPPSLDEDESHSIFAPNFRQKLNFHGNEEDKEIVEMCSNGKLDDDMTDQSARVLLDYIKEDVTMETDEYTDPSDSYYWQNPTYENVTFNGVQYVKATGKTVSKKDNGDAQMIYCTVVQGHIFSFEFNAEAAVWDEAIQEMINGIMNTITYTSK